MTSLSLAWQVTGHKTSKLPQTNFPQKNPEGKGGEGRGWEGMGGEAGICHRHDSWPIQTAGNGRAGRPVFKGGNLTIVLGYNSTITVGNSTIMGVNMTAADAMR